MGVTYLSFFRKKNCVSLYQELVCIMTQGSVILSRKTTAIVGATLAAHVGVTFWTALQYVQAHNAALFTPVSHLALLAHVLLFVRLLFSHVTKSHYALSTANHARLCIGVAALLLSVPTLLIYATGQSGSLHFPPVFQAQGQAFEVHAPNPCWPGTLEVLSGPKYLKVLNKDSQTVIARGVIPASPLLENVEEPLKAICRLRGTSQALEVEPLQLIRPGVSTVVPLRMPSYSARSYPLLDYGVQAVYFLLGTVLGVESVRRRLKFPSTVLAVGLATVPIPALWAMPPLMETYGFSPAFHNLLSTIGMFLLSRLVAALREWLERTARAVVGASKRGAARAIGLFKRAPKVSTAITTTAPAAVATPVVSAPVAVPVVPEAGTETTVEATVAKTD